MAALFLFFFLLFLKSSHWGKSSGSSCFVSFKAAEEHNMVLLYDFSFSRRTNLNKCAKRRDQELKATGTVRNWSLSQLQRE